jgi:hypothetical protein
VIYPGRESSILNFFCIDFFMQVEFSDLENVVLLKKKLIFFIYFRLFCCAEIFKK